MIAQRVEPSPLPSPRLIPFSSLPQSFVAIGQLIRSGRAPAYCGGPKTQRVESDCARAAERTPSPPQAGGVSGRDLRPIAVFASTETGKRPFVNASGGGNSMARRTGRDDDLFERLRALGVRKAPAKKAASAIRDSDKAAPKAARKSARPPPRRRRGRGPGTPRSAARRLRKPRAPGRGQKAEQFDPRQEEAGEEVPRSVSVIQGATGQRRAPSRGDLRRVGRRAPPWRPRNRGGRASPAGDRERARWRRSGCL